jgi:hypothetical protein
MSTFQQSILPMDPNDPLTQIYNKVMKDGQLNTVLDGIGGTVQKISTIWNQIENFGKSPEVVVEKPRAGSPEGTNVQNVDPKAAYRGADTITKIQQIYDQVKGLFGLGYPATESQPVAPITTEAGSALPFGLSMGALAVIGLVIILIAKK